MSYMQRGYLCVNNDQGQVKPGGPIHYLVHRIVYEEAHGEIPEGWIVHHINGDKVDNRIENLEALPRDEHPHRHRTKTKDGEAFCGGCDRWLPLDAFHRSRVRDTARQGHCKSCSKRKRDEWAAAHPERIAEYTRRAKAKYQSAHPMRRTVLTDDQVRAIRRDMRPGKEVAADFGISKWHVYDIRSGRKRSNVPDFA